MRLPKDQPFWTSVILHGVVLLALFLATIVEAFKPKEKPHVFEMVSPPAEQTSAAAPAPDTPPPPDVPLPDLPPVPEVATPVPQPKPQPKPSPPPKPKTISYEEFLKKNKLPDPKPRTMTPRPRVTVPKIDVPKLVVPSNPTASNPAPDQLTQQQMSALGTYSARLRSRIDVAWVKPASLAGVRIAATVVFDVSASGRITNVRLNPGSGNGSFDQSVLAAFRKISSAGPTPTGQSHSFSMTFRMTD